MKSAEVILGRQLFAEPLIHSFEEVVEPAVRHLLELKRFLCCLLKSFASSLGFGMRETSEGARPS